MGKYIPEDGVDGPFERALLAIERDDAKARLKRMVRTGATFVVHEPAGAEIAKLIKEAYGGDDNPTAHPHAPAGGADSDAP